MNKSKVMYRSKLKDNNNRIDTNGNKVNHVKSLAKDVVSPQSLPLLEETLL